MKVRDQMVASGEGEMLAFADRHLVFDPGAVLRGTDLTNLLEDAAPRSWERSAKMKFKQYLQRRLGAGQKSCRVGDKVFDGWKGVKLKDATDNTEILNRWTGSKTK